MEAERCGCGEGRGTRMQAQVEREIQRLTCGERGRRDTKTEERGQEREINPENTGAGGQ